MVDTRSIPIEHIDVGPRLRQVDHAFVQVLAGAMADNGQQQMIEVRPMPSGRFDLVDGAHRLAAGSANGWTHIDAMVRKMSDDEKELREIDANLVRRDLSPFDRATFLAHRQKVYVRLHPETAQGKAGAEGRWMQRNFSSFASETAEKAGVSPRYIRRLIARHTKIPEGVRALIVGTWIANSGPVLDALARTEPSDQWKCLTVMLRAENPVRSVKAALLLVNGAADAPRDMDAEQLGRLQRAWKDAGMQAKALFFLHLREQGFVEHYAKFSATREFGR
jgi:ParB family chromosome partitioning protein